MPIVVASERNSFRESILKFLETSKSTNKNLRVLDVGGGTNPWLGTALTHVIDLEIRQEIPGAIFTIGDINEPAVWENFPDKFFDFVSCTHTLEDVRDPGFVIGQINRIGRSGFVAVPNRHQEVSTLESPYWHGYCHHRWIFNVDETGLIAMAKWGPIAARPNPFLSGFLRYFFNSRSLLPGSRFRGAKWRPPLLNKTWHDSRLSERAPSPIELGVLWNESLPFQYWNRDFAGDGYESLMRMSNEFLQTKIRFEGDAYPDFEAVEAFFASKLGNC